MAGDAYRYWLSGCVWQELGPTRYWMAALVLAAIPLTERVMFAAITMARFNADWSFDTGRQLLLWAGFWAIPIALVFYLTRAHLVRVDLLLATFTGVAPT